MNTEIDLDEIEQYVQIAITHNLKIKNETKTNYEKTKRKKYDEYTYRMLHS